MKKILIVDDEEKIRELLKLNLIVGGYEVNEASNGLEALEKIENSKYDLVILDIMMPKLDGYEVAERLNNSVPIIFLSAKDSVLDKVKGLKLGVEDYITKPFETIELLARVENVIRRNSKEESNELVFKNIRVNVNEHIVYLNEKIVELTSKEFELLVLFIKNKNIALSRELLLDKVWNMDFLGDSRTVDMHINRLRNKMNLDEYLVTVRKYGYRLNDK